MSRKSGAYYYDHQDLLNSTTTILNDEGVMKNRYEYTPDGEVQSKTSTTPNEIQFTGHVQDESTGFTYMNARYYEPVTARFLTPDTYTGNPYNPNTQNVYCYTGNNPVNYVDPTGHIFISATLITIGIAVTTYLAALVSAPDFQLDLWELSDDIEQEKWGWVAFDVAAMLLPGIGAAGGKTAVNAIDALADSKVLDDVIEAGGDVAKGAASQAGKGFDSFNALKKELGSAGEGKTWHHIVEQSQIQKSGFSS